MSTTHPDGTEAKHNVTFDDFEVTCPWCDYSWPDSWELKMGDGEEDVHACPSCGRHVEVACEITVSYTARPVVTAALSSPVPLHAPQGSMGVVSGPRVDAALAWVVLGAAGLIAIAIAIASAVMW